MRIVGTSRTHTVPAAPNVNVSGRVLVDVDVVDEDAGSVEDVVETDVLGEVVEVVDGGDEVVVVGSTDVDVLVGADVDVVVGSTVVVVVGALVVVDVVTSVVVVVGATTVLMTTLVVVVLATVVGPHSLSR